MPARTKPRIMPIKEVISKRPITRNRLFGSPSVARDSSTRVVGTAQAALAPSLKRAITRITTRSPVWPPPKTAAVAMTEDTMPNTGP